MRTRDTPNPLFDGLLAWVPDGGPSGEVVRLEFGDRNGESLFDKPSKPVSKLTRARRRISVAWRVLLRGNEETEL